MADGNLMLEPFGKCLTYCRARPSGNGDFIVWMPVEGQDFGHFIAMRMTNDVCKLIDGDCIEENIPISAFSSSHCGKEAKYYKLVVLMREPSLSALARNRRLALLA